MQCNAFYCTALGCLEPHFSAMEHQPMQCLAMQHTQCKFVQMCSLLQCVQLCKVQIAEWRFVQWCSTIPDPACHPSGVHQMQFYAFYYIKPHRCRFKTEIHTIWPKMRNACKPKVIKWRSGSRGQLKRGVFTVTVSLCSNLRILKALQRLFLDLKQ